MVAGTGLRGYEPPMYCYPTRRIENIFLAGCADYGDKSNIYCYFPSAFYTAPPVYLALHVPIQ